MPLCLLVTVSLVIRTIDGEHLSAESFRRAFEQAFDAQDAERMEKLVAENPDRHLALFLSYTSQWIGRQTRDDAAAEKLLARARALGEAADAALEAPALLEMVEEIAAYDEEQIALWRKATSEFERGTMLRAQSQNRAALEPLQSARKNFEPLHWTLGVADAAQCAAGAQVYLGLHDDAIVNIQQALALYERMGSTIDIAAALGSLGGCHQALGQFEKAVSYLERAVKVGEISADKQVLIVVFGNLGFAEIQLGRLDDAASHFERGLDVADKAGDQAMAALLGGADARVMCVAGLAQLEHQRGNYTRSLAHAERALASAEKGTNSQLRGVSLLLLGMSHLGLGRYEKAMGFLEEGLAQIEATGNQQSIADALDDLGACHYELGQTERAISYHERALSLREKIGNSLMLPYRSATLEDASRRRSNMTPPAPITNEPSH